MAGQGAFGIPGAFVGELARIANQERPYWDGTRPIEQRGSFMPAARYDDGNVRPAVPNFVLDGFRALEGSGRNTYPESFTVDGPQDVANAGAYQDAARGFAGNMPIIGGGALATASGATKGALGIFGGRLARTADQAALSKAEQLAESGAPREQIWNETGWFQGPDKKWRFEIDDSNSNLLKPEYMDGPLGEQFNHADLYSAYPDMREMYSRFGDDILSSGSYTPHQSREHMGLFDLEEMINVNSIDPSRKLDIALHEAQHAVQQREKFGTGGSPSEFTNYDAIAYKEAWRAAQRVKSIGETPEQAAARISSLPGAMSDPEYLVDLMKKMSPDELLKKSGSLNPNAQYKRLAGETEARAVESRAALSPEQRRARAPWLDYDVPEADQIVRFK